METDIGNPIDYKSEIESLNKDYDNRDDFYDERQDHAYGHHMPPPPPPPVFPGMQQQWQPIDANKTNDVFSSIDKTAYIIIFVAFILGFFMGKTMQPVILRPSWGWEWFEITDITRRRFREICTTHDKWVF